MTRLKKCWSISGLAPAIVEEARDLQKKMERGESFVVGEVGPRTIGENLSLRILELCKRSGGTCKLWQGTESDGRPAI